MNWRTTILDFLGVRVDRAAAVTGMEFTLRHGSWLGLAVLALIALGTLAWWSHWRNTRDIATRPQRGVLVGLRTFLFALFLLLLLRPVLAFTLETTVRRSLVLLFDTSASMQIEDPRFADVDQKRAAMALSQLDPRRGLEQGSPAESKPVARRDLVRAIFASEVFDLENRLRKDYDLSVFTFGSTASEPGVASHVGEWLAKAETDAPATALGEAIREVLQRKRGQALAGIVVATDGASNTGTSPVEAARLARSANVPLHLYGVGVTSPRDIIVAGLVAQETAFVKDEFSVGVRVRGRGLKDESAELVLQLGDKVVGRQQVKFESDAEQTIALPFTPEQVGEYQLCAKIEPRGDEAVKDNNTITQRLRVVDARVKVLYVESTPRWEFRYIQAALLRDRRLDAKSVLIEGDPSIAEGEGSPFLPHVPEQRDEWFKYDLIILGDISPKDLGPDAPAWLEEYVSKFGGSLLVLAGPRGSPGCWHGTQVEKLLPVDLPDAEPAPAPAAPFTFELTPQGRTSPLLQLADTEAQNAIEWARLGPLYWAARAGRQKAGAQVLMVDPDPAKATRWGKMPLIALQQYGLGQVLYIGTDNTWRWRRNAAEPLHGRLWSGIAQKLGMAHVLGGSRRTQLSTDRQNYTVGDHVLVFARLYTADYSPVRSPEVEARVTVKGKDAPQTVTLRAVPEQPGMFRGEFTATVDGTHELRTALDPEALLEFGVVEARFEIGESAMNEGLLKQMAELSNGGFYREENLYSLPDSLRAHAETIKNTVDAELWSSPLYFLLLGTVATVEWVLRKRWQLK